MNVLEKLHNSTNTHATKQAKFELAHKEKLAQDTYAERIKMLQQFTLRYVQSDTTQNKAVQYINNDEFQIPTLEIQQ